MYKKLYSFLKKEGARIEASKSTEKNRAIGYLERELQITQKRLEML